MVQFQNEASNIPMSDVPWEKIYAAKLDLLYPDFSDWLTNTVLPGLHAGSRRLFLHDQGCQFGLVVAKRSLDERKLCTVYVDRASRGNGIASCLISQAVEWLGTDKPLITISEDRLVEFEPLIRKLDFSLTQVAHSYYRRDTREFVFNGRLPNVPNLTLKSREQIPQDPVRRVRYKDIPAMPPGPLQRRARIFDAPRLHA
jgi:hypothetical protein